MLSFPDINFHPGGHSDSVPVCKALYSPAPALIPIPLWQAHQRKPAAEYLAALPDGTPLRMTAEGMMLVEQVTGSLLWPEDTWQAAVHLWAATLTDAELEALWEAPEPEDEEAAVQPLLARHAPGLAKRVRQWMRQRLPAAAGVYAVNLARALWSRENGVALEIDRAAMPQEEGDEKKNPAAGLTGSSPDSPPSPEATPYSGLPSGACATATSSPLTAHGSTPTDSPPSPPEPGPAESGNSMTSSPAADDT